MFIYHIMYVMSIYIYDLFYIWVNLITTEACSPEACNQSWLDRGKSSPFMAVIQATEILYCTHMYIYIYIIHVYRLCMTRLTCDLPK